VRLEAVVHDRGVDCDASTEKRGGSRKVQVIWNSESELFFCRDVLRVATLGNMSLRPLVFFLQEW